MADYYPFGHPLRTSKTNEETHYRYSYQGQYAEEDEETGWSFFELRMYDPIVARFMRVDPYRQYFSPYEAMGNNPIKMVDPNGGQAGSGEGNTDDPNYFDYGATKQLSDVTITSSYTGNNRDWQSMFDLSHRAAQDATRMADLARFLGNKDLHVYDQMFGYTFSSNTGNNDQLGTNNVKYLENIDNLHLGFAGKRTKNYYESGKDAASGMDALASFFGNIFGGGKPKLMDIRNNVIKQMDVHKMDTITYSYGSVKYVRDMKNNQFIKMTRVDTTSVPLN